MTEEENIAIIAGQLAELTQHRRGDGEAAARRFSKRAASQQIRVRTLQQERIDHAARELTEVSDRLQAAANALRQVSLSASSRSGEKPERSVQRSASSARLAANNGRRARLRNGELTRILRSVYSAMQTCGMATLTQEASAILGGGPAREAEPVVTCG